MNLLSQSPLILLVIVGFFMMKNKFGKMTSRRKDSREARDERYLGRSFKSLKPRFPRPRREGSSEIGKKKYYVA
jgi:hypothetical protein